MQCLFAPVKTGLRRQKVVFYLNTGWGAICAQRLKSIGGAGRIDLLGFEWIFLIFHAIEGLSTPGFLQILNTFPRLNPVEHFLPFACIFFFCNQAFIFHLLKFTELLRGGT